MTDNAQIRLECLKIGNDICKSHNIPYGTDELRAEAEKIWEVLYPKLLQPEAENPPSSDNELHPVSDIPYPKMSAEARLQWDTIFRERGIKR